MHSDGGDINSVDDDFPLCGIDEPQNAHRKRTLAAARPSKESDTLSSFEFEGYAL